MSTRPAVATGAPRMPRAPSPLRAGAWLPSALTCIFAAGPATAQPQPAPDAINRGVVGGAPAVPTDGPLPTAPIIPVRTATLNFGASVEAIFSDNFLIGDEANEASGRSLEIAPYMEGYLRTAKSRGVMAARLRGLWYDTNSSDDTSLSPDVRANGDFSIIGDQLRLAGSAYVFRESPSPFAATAIDPGGSAAETSLYRDYAISPYSLGRVGGADYELRYQARSTDPGDITPSSVSNQIFGGLSSSRDAATNLGWTATADTERIDFEDDTGLDRSNAELLAYYRVRPTLRVGAGVNYARVDVLLNADGDDSGFGPSAFVSWRPTRRSTLSARWADTYYGNESAVSFTHRRARWLLGLTYVRSLEIGSSASLLYLDPSKIYLLSDESADEGALLIQSLSERRVSSGAGSELAFGQTGASLVFAENLVASLVFSRPRNALVLSLFMNDQKPIQSELSSATEYDLLQRGITLDADHRLTQSSSLFLSTQYSQSESDQRQQDSRLASFAVGWRTSLSRQAAFTLTLRTTRQTSEGDVPSHEYRENAAIAALDYRF